MSHFARLQLVARVTYYVGWIALACGALIHVNIGRALFSSIDLSQRNMFELSVVSFLVCVASDLRVIAGAEKEVPAAAARPIAA